MEEVAHHEDRQHETGDEQRDAEDETDGRSLAKRQADDEAGYKEYKTDNNAEGETVGTVKRPA